jgi:hypothetical protein
MGRSMKPGKQTWIWLLSLLLLGAMATASAVDSDEDGSANQIDSATIEQAMGVDQNVDYAELRRFGPWDDRNYALTEADVALLPENDEFRHGVPAFFKIERRKEAAAEGYPIGEHITRARQGSSSAMAACCRMAC